MNRNRNWCFTINNYTMQDLIKLRTLVETTEWLRYIIFGKEIAPTTGTKHLQGYCELGKQFTMGQLKKHFHKTAHYEKRRGTQQEAITYCKKEGDFEEFGTPKKDKQACGESRWNNILQDVKDGLTYEQLLDKHPGSCARYLQGVKNIMNTVHNGNARRALIAKLDKCKLNIWQQDAVKLYLEQNDREILWVLDPVGGIGKSFLANWLEMKHNAFVISNGKSQDIAHAWNLQEHIVFDFTRSKRESINYDILEQFKNGRVFSPKYDSITKRSVNTPKVIAFANWEPNYSMLSLDRWKTMEVKACKMGKEIIYKINYKKQKNNVCARIRLFNNNEHILVNHSMDEMCNDPIVAEFNKRLEMINNSL